MRFPGAGLAGVAQDLASPRGAATRNAEALARPSWWSRLLPVLFCGSLALQRVLSAAGPEDQVTNTEATNLLQTFRSRPQRGRLRWRGRRSSSLACSVGWAPPSGTHALHQLRSPVHVIDMHQLTKDPSLVLGKEHNTVASPKRHMTDFEKQLSRLLQRDAVADRQGCGPATRKGLDDAVVIRP